MPPALFRERLVLAGMHANICVIGCVLLGSLYIQLVMGEFPCPLCMNQRTAMLLCALGQAYALCRMLPDGRMRIRDFAVGQGMTLIAALSGAAMAARQILLHILPGDPGYASAILGLHTYTWAFLVFAAQALAVGANLLLYPMNDITVREKTPPRTRRVLLFLAALIAAIGVATFVEQGFHWTLPGDPVSNRLFEDLGLVPPKPVPGDACGIP